MPEGPEIRRAADKLAAALVGRPLTKVEFGLEPLKRYEAILEGGTVRAIRTVGKAMLTAVEAVDGDVWVIYTHNQLYGRWSVRKAGPYPSSRRSLRLALVTAEKMALLYSASEIAVLPAGEEQAHPFVAKAGPDVLDRAITADAVEARLLDKRFARRRLAGLLLDQAFVCGLGNYLRSEALFLAGVDPRARPADLPPANRRALAEAILGTARQAYETAGVTMPPEVVAPLKAAGQPRWAYRHWVFGRAGRPCRRCGGRIERREEAGRRVYVCGACQPVGCPGGT